MLKIYIFFLLYVFVIFFLIYIKKYVQYNNQDYIFDHYYINKNNLSQMFINAIALYNQRLPYIMQTYNKFISCKGKKKVIIVLLHYNNIQSFINRNYYFLNFKYYDELIFFVTEKKSSISEYRGILYKIINLSDSFYKFPYKFNKSEYTPSYQKGGLWNYQHMCRFFFKDIFFHPVMCDVNLFMRLDSDSFINTSLNLFKHMNKNIVYMHNKVMHDGASVTQGLKNFVYSYITTLKIKSKDEINFNLTFKNNPLLYYNNFEICRTSFFRSKEMFQFSNIVDLSYGQFIYRWGDAPLRYISLSLFAKNSSKIEIPKEVYYCHHTCNNK